MKAESMDRIYVALDTVSLQEAQSLARLLKCVMTRYARVLGFEDVKRTRMFGDEISWRLTG